jgi:hypothetical protein
MDFPYQFVGRHYVASSLYHLALSGPEFKYIRRDFASCGVAVVVIEVNFVCVQLCRVAGTWSLLGSAVNPVAAGLIITYHTPSQQP